MTAPSRTCASTRCAISWLRCSSPRARRCCWAATSSAVHSTATTTSYCQDNEINWLDWNIGERGESLIQFVQHLARLRHSYAILRRNRFLTGDYNPELDVKDVTWINASGAEMQEENWKDTATRCFGMLMDGRAQSTGIRQRGKDATLLWVLNAHHDVSPVHAARKRRGPRVVAAHRQQHARDAGRALRRRLCVPGDGALTVALRASARKVTPSGSGSSLASTLQWHRHSPGGTHPGIRLVLADGGGRTRAEGGMGIGLALAKGIVEMHGGTIEARSPGRGHGSEFIATLPLCAVLPSEGRPSPVAPAGSIVAERIGRSEGSEAASRAGARQPEEEQRELLR